MNAELNHVYLETTTKNLIGNKTVSDLYDVVILGDVFYDEEIANWLISWLNFLLAKDKFVSFSEFIYLKLLKV
jgi:predicted nicotinamide N-methyase